MHKPDMTPNQHIELGHFSMRFIKAPNDPIQCSECTLWAYNLLTSSGICGSCRQRREMAAARNDPSAQIAFCADCGALEFRGCVCDVDGTEFVRRT